MSMDVVDRMKGPLRGVRFWSYQFIDPSNRQPPRNITSFQHDIEWFANRPAASGTKILTIENERGLNVYNTEQDALRGSADAVEGVIANVEGYAQSRSGLVLGAVEFWGQAVKHEFGWHSQYVKPCRFLRGWGHEPRKMVGDLNTLWFENDALLSFEERVLLAIQRGGFVCAADIDEDLKQISAALTVLEALGFVRFKHDSVFDGKWKQQQDRAWDQGVCLTCNRPARDDKACAAGRPRLYWITVAGQEALLKTLRGGRHG